MGNKVLEDLVTDDLVTDREDPNLKGDDDSPEKTTWDKIKFDSLWDNYPSSKIEHIGKSKKDEYGNHCAIHLSESLYQSGLGIKGNCSKSLCPSKGFHVLGATDLSNRINQLTSKVKTINKKILTGKTYEDYVDGKTGIIYFEDYWQRPNEKGNTRTGDHIDLWDGNELASIGAFKTWIRQSFSQFSEDYLDMSDLKKAKKVIFWEIE